MRSEESSAVAPLPSAVSHRRSQRGPRTQRAARIRLQAAHERASEPAREYASIPACQHASEQGRRTTPVSSLAPNSAAPALDATTACSSGVAARVRPSVAARVRPFELDDFELSERRRAARSGPCFESLCR